MGVIEVKYFNSFVLKKVMGNINGTDSPIWNGSKGDNTYGNAAYVPNPAVIVLLFE